MKNTLAILIIALFSLKSAAQHSHLNVGALGKNQGDKLFFANGNEFATSSSYVKTLNYTNSARYAGYYEGGITLTALPETAPFGGPDPDAAAFGSYIQFSMSCLEGPEGGTFQFWEVTGTTPALSLASGETNATLFRLSESDGSPGSDPYGHIHGRRFTATKPGVYKIGFKAWDTSTNGVNGGPIHTPSDVLPVWFEAGVNIVFIEPDYEEGHVHIKFGAPAGFSWQIEATRVLGPQANWQPAGNPIVGADVFVATIHDVPPGLQRFYRVKGTPIIP